MTAIMRRELTAYFSSPIGYIYLAVFYLFAAYFFFGTTLMSNLADISPVFDSLFTIVLFLIPILTMRLFSEDLKHRTDQALLTAPINLTSLVMGKFMAAVAVFLIGLAVTIVFAVIVAVFAPPNWALIWGNFIALLLFGMSMISIGMFISSLTENQVIAAVGAFGVSLGLLLTNSLSGLFYNPILVIIFDSLSFMSRYQVFTFGIFDLGHTFFFLSVSATFVFLTIRVLEKRRWS